MQNDVGTDAVNDVGIKRIVGNQVANVAAPVCPRKAADLPQWRQAKAFLHLAEGVHRAIHRRFNNQVQHVEDHHQQNNHQQQQRLIRFCWPFGRDGGIVDHRIGIGIRARQCQLLGTLIDHFIHLFGLIQRQLQVVVTVALHRHLLEVRFLLFQLLLIIFLVRQRGLVALAQTNLLLS
ncbi:hypothetical protein D3C75_225690 [compost metagenome]